VETLDRIKLAAYAIKVEWSAVKEILPQSFFRSKESELRAQIFFDARQT